jgi:hypothetical protein
MDDAARIRGDLVRDHLWRLVRAAVVDDVDTHLLLRVAHLHQAFDGPPDHRALVPGGNDDCDPRIQLGDADVGTAPDVEPGEEELVAADHQHGGPAEDHRDEGDVDDVDHAPSSLTTPTQ